MGVAGQIFAARVAIGLAVPSPRALVDTGGMLASGIQKIYKQLNGQRVQAAKQRVSESETELTKARQKFDTHSAGMANNVLKNTKQGMAALVAEGGRLESQFAKQGADAFKSLKGALQQEDRAALFKGISKDMDSMQKLMQMTENFTKMSKKQQDDIIKGAKQVVTAKKRQLDAVADETEEKQKSLNADLEAGKITEKQYTRKSRHIQRQLDLASKEYESAKDQKEIIDSLSGVYDRKYNKELEENNRLKEKVTMRERMHKKAVDLLKKAQEQLNAKAKEYSDKIINKVNAGVQNYSNVLRETVSVLTAFYYKLNQSTQQLIEFERELMNANSVFNVTRDELFATSNQIVQFGQQFGMEMQNGATGLYQLASAGLAANEASMVLPETLKLSMAVQGDHNTIAKLTTQTLAGFGMEMSETALLTDKFAHAIQKSLIEYEDLSSAVKFALPFFTATGQSIDQLLGALQILTNRALEAGIAGRGLRQALAEFAENADNNEAAFRKMGINIKTATGEMKQLTEIAAEFAQVVGEDTVNNTELLSTLIDDLNVRGATAFIHLVQASDEFTEAVENTANAGGELDEMVRIQNESLFAQIQILKNNMQMMFFMADGNEYATGAMNGFHHAILLAIEDLQGLLVVEEQGGYALTEFGKSIQDIAINGVGQLRDFLKALITTVQEFTSAGFMNMDMLKIYLIPLKIALGVVQAMGPELTKLVLTFHVLNKSIMLGAILQGAWNIITGIGSAVMGLYKLIIDTTTLSTWGLYTALIAVTAGLILLPIALIAVVKYLQDASETGGALSLFLGNTLELLKGIVAWVGNLGESWEIGAKMFAFGQWIMHTLYMILDLPNALGQAFEAVVATVVNFYKEHEMIIDLLLTFLSIFFPGGVLIVGLLMVKKYWGEIADIMEKVIAYVMQYDWAEKAITKVVEIVTKETGGMMPSYATGGLAMVGERGPEMIKLPGAAKVFNTSKTRSILEQGLEKSGIGSAVGNIMDKEIVIRNAKIQKATIGLDTFKGGMTA